MHGDSQNLSILVLASAHGGNAHCSMQRGLTSFRSVTIVVELQLALAVSLPYGGNLGLV